jgi:Thioredoxin
MTQQRTKERQEERKKQQQRRQVFIFGGGIAITILVVVIMALVANAPASAPIPSEFATRYEGLERNRNDNNMFMLGRANPRIDVQVFASFTSPEALNMYDTIYPALIERVRAGDVSLTFIPLRTATGANPDGAARTAYCAGQQGRFWEAVDALFLWYRDFGSAAFSNPRIIAGVTALGLDINTFRGCFGDGAITDSINRAAQNINNNPTVRVNGTAVELTLEAINEAIDGFMPSTEATSEVTAEMTAEVTSEVTAEMTAEVTTEMTEEATSEAMAEMTAEVTVEPTAVPTARPTTRPTLASTVEVTTEVTEEATVEMTPEATIEPTTVPTTRPTARPTVRPTTRPTIVPTAEATAEATATP